MAAQLQHSLEMGGYKGRPYVKLASVAGKPEPVIPAGSHAFLLDFSSNVLLAVIYSPGLWEPLAPTANAMPGAIFGYRHRGFLVKQIRTNEAKRLLKIKDIVFLNILKAKRLLINNQVISD